MKLYRTLDELEISGTISELAEIHKSLNSATENYSEVFTFDTSGSPEPYKFLDSTLRVSFSPKSACATFNVNDGVIITGNVESLKALASFFYFESDSKSGEHCHWDNACDPEYTAQETLPIVVSVS